MQTSEAITRKSASNLALAFVLLPRARRDGMAVLYAFCREVDDVADEDNCPVAERRERLGRWRRELRGVYAGVEPTLPVLRELGPVIRDYGLPLAQFEEVLDGVEMDLEVDRFATLPELEAYCYRVASAVGLLSIHVFGFKDPACRRYADHLGKALQLTNILRDVRVDAGRGRIYLPGDVLVRHGVTEAEILGGRYSPRYEAVAGELAARARYHYAAARAALPGAERRAMLAAELMGSVYWQLLLKLEKARFDVFGERPIRLSKVHKLALIARAWVLALTGSSRPGYATS